MSQFYIFRCRFVGTKEDNLQCREGYRKCRKCIPRAQYTYRYLEKICELIWRRGQKSLYGHGVLRNGKRVAFEVRLRRSRLGILRTGNFFVPEMN